MLSSKLGTVYTKTQKEKKTTYMTNEQKNPTSVLNMVRIYNSLGTMLSRATRA